MASTSSGRYTAPGRVRRRHEEQHLGPVRAGRFELVDGHLEPGSQVVGSSTGTPPARRIDLGVGRPVRRREQHLVAGVEQGGEGLLDGLLAAVGDEDLGGGHRVARSPAGVLAAIASLQLGQAAGGRVLVVAGVAAGLGGGLDDVGRGREVRFAGAEADDVLARRLEGLGLGVDGEGGRFGDGGYAVGDTSHCCHACTVTTPRSDRYPHPRRSPARRRALRLRAVQGPPRGGRRPAGRRRDPARHQPPPGAGEVAGRPAARRAGELFEPARRLRGGARQRRHHGVLGRGHLRPHRRRAAST